LKSAEKDDSSGSPALYRYLRGVGPRQAEGGGKAEGKGGGAGEVGHGPLPGLGTV